MKGSWWFNALFVFLIIVGLSRCSGSDDDLIILPEAESPTEEIQDANLVALHSISGSTADNLCITCHGDMTDDTTLDPDIIGIHSLHEVEINYACTTCHVNTDLLFGSGAKLRKQVDTETICADCHSPGGLGIQLYQE
jgi:hypothetical protein